MKRLLLMGMIGLCLPTGPVRADPNGTVLGVIAGTAAGLIIANNAHGVNPWVAAPVGAVLGGYIGSQYDRRGRYDRYGNDAWGYRRRDPYYRHGYDRGYYCDGYYPEPPTTVIYVEKEKEKKVSPIEAPTDVHPGVDLIKVSILNSNGIRTDVPILRVKGKFVGPQGEEYETLPTAETLTKRYGM